MTLQYLLHVYQSLHNTSMVIYILHVKSILLRTIHSVHCYSQNLQKGGGKIKQTHFLHGYPGSGRKTVECEELSTEQEWHCLAPEEKNT